MEVDRVSDVIEDLKKECITIVDEIHNKGRILPISRSRKNKVTEFTSTMNSHHAGYTSVVIEKPNWQPIIEKIIEEKLEKNGLISSLASYLTGETTLPKKHDNPIPQTEMWLHTFFTKFLEEELEAKYEKRKIKSTAHYVTNLISELNEIPLTTEFILKETGVYISSNDTILRHFSFQKTKAQDLEEIESFTNSPFRHMPDGVIKFKLKSSQFDGWKHGQKILDLFTLFRLSSVNFLSFKTESRSMIWPGSSGVQTPIDTPRRRYVYELKDEDIVNFDKFCESFFSILESQDDKEKDMFGFKISLARYKNATIDVADDGRNLMTAIIGLEALYTAKHEVGEIKYRLALRVARLLGCLSINSETVRKDIEKAYVFRNTIGHGSDIDPNDRQEVMDLLKKIANILRISIIIFGIMLQKLKKNQLIFGIDDLMLLSKNEKLDESIVDVKEKIPDSVLRI